MHLANSCQETWIGASRDPARTVEDVTATWPDDSTSVTHTQPLLAPMQSGI